MHLHDPNVAGWLRRHHDVASVAELIRLGLTREQIRRLVGSGALVPVHRGVYRTAGAPATNESRARAACTACESVVVAGPSAGRLWGLRRLPADPRLHVLTGPATTPLTGADVVVRRTTLLPAEDVVARADGIRLTSPPRTAFDLAALVPDDVLESIVEQVLDRSCTFPTLLRSARRLTGRGRDGSARFTRVIASRPAWQRPADSDLEVRVFRALERRGVVLVRQHRIQTSIGAIHLDGADPGISWGLEVDHVTWHGGRLDAQYDKIRDRAARLVGWQIERVTDLELGERFDQVLDELAALHAMRCRARHRAA